MRLTEERSDPRQPLHLSLRFHILHEGNSKQFSSETSNVSLSGFFMRTHVRLKLGTLLSLSLRIPPSVPGGDRLYFHCTGRVIHEQQFPGGRQGYGVHIEQALPRPASPGTKHQETDARIAWR